MVFNLPVVLAFWILMRRNKDKPIEKHTQPPYWLAWYFDKAHRFSNAVHDYLVAPLLGSGRCSTQEQQVLTRKRIQKTMALDIPQDAQAEQEPELVKLVEKVVESTAP